MLKELRVINSEYQPQYDSNPLIKNIMDRTMKCRLDPKPCNQFVTKDEKQGLMDFEELQVGRDKKSIEVYKKFQTEKYVEMMIYYNDKRRDLRLDLMDKKITWKQFGENLEDLIIKNRSKESEYRDKKDVQPSVS